MKLSLPLYCLCMAFVFQGKTSLLQNNKTIIIILFPVLYRCFIHMEGILHIPPSFVSSRKYYIHPSILLHSNASLYLCMFSNQMVYSLVQEAVPILAPTLSLRSIYLSIYLSFYRCVFYIDYTQQWMAFDPKPTRAMQHPWHRLSSSSPSKSLRGWKSLAVQIISTWGHD